MLYQPRQYLVLPLNESADDTMIWSTDKSVKDGRLQDDLDTLSEWSQKWQLQKRSPSDKSRAINGI